MKQNQRRRVETSICLQARDPEGQGTVAPGVCRVRSALKVLMLSALVCWCPKLCILGWDLSQRRASCSKRRQMATERDHEYAFFMEDLVLAVS